MENQKELFRPIKSRRTFEEVSGNIKELIFDGTLKPGDKLPSEAQLSHQFNVGRQTIREALRLLEYSGFIAIKQGGGGGPVIKDTLLSSISALFVDAFRMKKITIQDLAVTRLEIEKVIISYALDNADETDVANLRKNVVHARKMIEQGKRATEDNFEFHILLAKASKNHMFVLVMRSVMAVHADLISRTGFDLEVSRSVVEAHERVVDAFERKDREETIRLFEQHLSGVSDQLQALVETEEEPG